MVAFRTLVAVLVTVVTLFGGAFRAQTMLRAQVVVQNAEGDAPEATFDLWGNAVQRRATKPSTPEPRDGIGPALASLAGIRIASREAQATDAPAPNLSEPHRRVRRHVENMVFLI